MIWLVMSGRGFGKSLVGSTWLTKQALTHPNSEWAVFAPTFRDVRKTCIEGETGILAALDMEHDLAHYRRNELQIILSNGSVIYGYSADQPERARGANLWGAWCDELGCLIGSTLIRTASGDVPIKDVRAGDYVHTRSGLRRVLWSGPTRRNAVVWELTTADGRRVVCTPDHRVWTDSGWTQARDVTPGTMMYAWENPSSSTDPRRGSHGTASAGTGSTSATTTTAATTATLAETCCTGQCGSARTGRSRTAQSSITATMTRSTTTSATCNCSTAGPTTRGTTPKSGITRTGSPTARATRRGTARADSGPIANPGRSTARFAVSSSNPPVCAPSSVAGRAGRASVVVGSRMLPCREAVTYDLTVEGEPEFYANGLLVHNSWRYETTWHEGLVPALRRGKNPRIVVTTTPRPTRLIKDLSSRKDGSVHITRGSTWENARNLAASALAELKRRYEGTRIGRQELEGELLEDIEGALWVRSNIDADRVKLADVPDLTRVVVAIDPAVTSNEDSDESGIVVVGYSGTEGYVLGDYSMIGTPNEVIKRAIRAYQIHNADVIVAEVNNGGDWIGALLRTVDTNIPYDVVRASRGKAIRAEPISSLYEQHRMHHVGSFPELEDQMCGFVPGVTKDSPDRMDALVWAATACTGMVAGDWNDAYGTIKCFTCGHVYVLASHKQCPKCGTVN